MVSCPSPFSFSYHISHTTFYKFTLLLCAFSSLHCRSSVLRWTPSLTPMYKDALHEVLFTVRRTGLFLTTSNANPVNARLNRCCKKHRFFSSLHIRSTGFTTREIHNNNALQKTCYRRMHTTERHVNESFKQVRYHRYVAHHDMSRQTHGIAKRLDHITQSAHSRNA